MALILAATARLHGKKSLESEVVVDTTVQEKNVTYPVDTKLYRKLIVRCWREADRHGFKLRRRYAKEVRRCVQVQRCGKIRANASSRTRPSASCAKSLSLVHRSKGTVHASKSCVMTKESCVIVAAVAHPENIYDGHTLPEVLQMAEAVQGRRAAKAIVDRGYRGRRWVEGTEVLTPNRPPNGQSKAQSARMRARFRRRSAIKPSSRHQPFQTPIPPPSLLPQRLLGRSTQPDAGRLRLEPQEMDTPTCLFLAPLPPARLLPTITQNRVTFFRTNYPIKSPALPDVRA